VCNGSIDSPESDLDDGSFTTKNAVVTGPSHCLLLLLDSILFYQDGCPVPISLCGMIGFLFAF
jgi:hypothetical protein